MSWNRLHRIPHTADVHVFGEHETPKQGDAGVERATSGVIDSTYADLQLVSNQQPCRNKEIVNLNDSWKVPHISGERRECSRLQQVSITTFRNFGLPTIIAFVPSQTLSTRAPSPPFMDLSEVKQGIVILLQHFRWVNQSLARPLLFPWAPMTRVRETPTEKR